MTNRPEGTTRGYQTPVAAEIVKIVMESLGRVWFPPPAVTRLPLGPVWVRLPNSPPSGTGVNGSTLVFQTKCTGSNPVSRSMLLKFKWLNASLVRMRHWVRSPRAAPEGWCEAPQTHSGGGSIDWGSPHELIGSKALMVKLPALNRMNSDRYRVDPPCASTPTAEGVG